MERKFPDVKLERCSWKKEIITIFRYKEWGEKNVLSVRLDFLCNTTESHDQYKSCTTDTFDWHTHTVFTPSEWIYCVNLKNKHDYLSSASIFVEVKGNDFILFFQ